MNAAMIFFTCLVAIFTSLVAYFTYRLVEATKNYTEVTKKLLEQSREALQQSRISFLASIVAKTIEYAEEKLQKKQQDIAVESIKNKTKGLSRISKEVAEVFLQAMIDWSGSDTNLRTKLEKFQKTTLDRVN